MENKPSGIDKEEETELHLPNLKRVLDSPNTELQEKAVAILDKLDKENTSVTEGKEEDLWYELRDIIETKNSIFIGIEYGKEKFTLKRK